MGQKAVTPGRRTDVRVQMLAHPMANLLSGAACSFKISDGLAGSMRSMRSMSVVTGDG
jgi:hypothetical protein